MIDANWDDSEVVAQRYLIKSYITSMLSSNSFGSVCLDTFTIYQGVELYGKDYDYWLLYMHKYIDEFSPTNYNPRNARHS